MSFTIQDERTKPFSLEEIRERHAKGERIEGVVSVPLSLMLSCSNQEASIERFNDHVSRRLVGSDLLSDIWYNLIGCDAAADLLYFEIDGDPSLCLVESEDT